MVLPSYSLISEVLFLPIQHFQDLILSPYPHLIYLLIKRNCVTILLILIQYRMGNICYTYQHTCLQGHDAYILKNAPFKAAVKKINGIQKIPFLGEGHYLWEENVDAAIRWGKKHYDNKYTIVEYQDLKIKAEELLDLTDRRHISYFKDLQ